MGYRYKTCSYCNGNHAILDCPKLPVDAENARKALKTWETVGFVAWQKAVLYDSVYGYKRQVKSDGTTEYAYELAPKDRADRQVRHYLSKEYEYDYDSLPKSIPYDKWHEHTRDRYNTQRSYQRIIDRHEANQEKVRKRANKSCSYCREAGHTVRTCSRLKEDYALHQKAHMISSYKYARALSRFGIWTGAMAAINGKMPQMANVRHFSTNLLMMPSGNDLRTSYSRQDTGEYERLTAEKFCEKAGISVEDLCDFFYLKSALEGGIRFQAMEEEGYYSGSSYRLYGTAEVCFKTNTVMPETLNGRGSQTGTLYKSSATLEHIYRRISARYVKPDKAQKYGQNEVNGVRNIDDGYSARYDLYDKKKRNEGTWSLLEKFVKENQDILNKIKKLNV